MVVDATANMDAMTPVPSGQVQLGSAVNRHGRDVSTFPVQHADSQPKHSALACVRGAAGAADITGQQQALTCLQTVQLCCDECGGQSGSHTEKHGRNT